MRMAQGLVLAAAILGGAVALAATASSDDPPARYQVAAQGDGVWRLDTTTGEMIWCRRIIADYRAEDRMVKSDTGVTTLRGRSFDATVECFGRDGQVSQRIF